MPIINKHNQIQSVERAMLVLETIADVGGEVRLIDLTAQLGLNKSTLHGLLSTLASMGYVDRNGTKYRLGLRLRAITQPIADEDAQLREAFRPALLSIYERTGMNSYLAVPSGTSDYLCLDVLRTPVSAQQKQKINTGLINTAIGKVFLAYDKELLRSIRKAGPLPTVLEQELDSVNLQGYALDLEEAETGLNCVALPLRRHGKVVAALSVSGSSEELKPTILHQIAKNSMREMFDLLKL